MEFLATSIAGLWLIELERHVDERGFFARTYCREEMAERGVDAAVVQQNLSFSSRRGTVRGLHFAWPAHREGKLVRAGRGSLLAAVVDLRPESPTYLQVWQGEIDDSARRQLWVPPGCAFGFQTLSDATEVLYSMSAAYRAECGGGYRYDDPAFALVWPLPVTVIAERDREYADFDAAAHRRRWLAANGTGA